MEIGVVLWGKADFGWDKQIATVWRNGEAGITVTVLCDIEAHTAPASAKERDRTL